MNVGAISTIVALVFLAVLFLAITFTAPFILLWSLNTLFHLAVPYTARTWFAAFVFWSVFVAWRSRA